MHNILFSRKVRSFLNMFLQRIDGVPRTLNQTYATCASNPASSTASTNAAGCTLLSSKLITACAFSKLTSACTTPSSSVNTRVTLFTQPPQVIPSIFNVTFCIICSFKNKLNLADLCR
ncbi:hypothetical protein CF65_00129 [Aggregatibacter actinomycetemcomitans HK1651]|nr:hypothetical protein CF65_00129 [Aggregatibacter actinomycetemcomitans HK1651]